MRIGLAPFLNGPDALYFTASLDRQSSYIKTTHFFGELGSERSLRLAVTKHKVCGGSRSMTGFAQMAVLLTVIQTCRAQGRSALVFFQETLFATASRNDLTMSSLIPATST
jgi:hypothetical protein